MNEDMLVRSFDAEMTVADGRTIVGRAVPYGVAATVADHPGGPAYREMFDHGAFRRATRAPHHVVMRHEHGGTLLDMVGRAMTLEERDDGLYGEWRALDGAVGDQALALIDAGILRGLSVSFRPLGPGRRETDGTVVRTSCHLDEVSLTRTPAYTGAEVMSVRTRLAGPERDAALDERLRRLGYLA